jgi:hypothetical protein
MTTRLAIVLLAFVPARFLEAQEKVDLAAIHRIKEEAFQRSQLMDHVFYLTDVYGPRLTGSPGYAAAANWAVERLKEWGLSDARLEEWGEFGRGWHYRRLTIRMLEPAEVPLSGIPLAWSSGTEGAVQAYAHQAPLFSEDKPFQWYNLDELTAAVDDYIAKQKGKLRNQVVLISPLRKFEPAEKPASRRLESADLDALARAPEPAPVPPFEYPLEKLPKDEKAVDLLFEYAPAVVQNEYFERIQLVRDKLNRFLTEEGVTAVLATDSRGDGGLIFAEEGGSYAADAPEAPPSIVLAPENYNRLARLLEKQMKVKVEVDLDAALLPPQKGFNVVAEIPGGKKKDEVVMLGAHFDSWHGGTGAADNAAGSAVMLEAMRVLQALRLPMDRTVRLGLWGGEEQGFFGSLGYVKKHFGDPLTMSLRPEHARLAAYFNVDNGSGKIRGVYLQGNDMVRPIFEAWLQPFHDLGATTLTIRNTGGTDHLSFDALGLPGFQFIQDPLDYGSRTHHSNLDVYDHIVSGDLMQAAAIVASFAYHAAARNEMLPRKPLPPPVAVKKTSDR